jgi:uncharacterized protein
MTTRPRGSLHAHELLFATTLAFVAVTLHATTTRAEELTEIENPRTTQGSWVSDPSRILSAFEAAEIDTTITALNQKNGAEIALVVVRDIPSGYSAKSLATHLFNTWGVGVKGADNGVLVLFALNARRIEVETGYGAEGVLPDGKVGAILDAHAVPYFKQSDYATGLLHTVRALARELAKGEPAYSRALRRVGLNVPLAGGGLAVLLVIAVVIALVRLSRRPPRCPDCGEPMRKLDPQQERAYLNKEDLFEEDLGSVDHIVWRCDRDREMKITRRNKWLSGYEKCRQCDRLTATRTTQTTRHPTYTSTGERRVVVTCRLPRCRHVFTYTETIPRRVRSTSTSSGYRSSSSSFGGGGSSRSSSSFGGGRSGGGGAGRSW